jgi:hypothetical protein
VFLRYTYLYLALVLSVTCAEAQRSSLALKGLQQRCYAVSVADLQLPVDSLVLDSGVVIPDTAVYLICMAAASDVSVAGPALGVVANAAGFVYRTSIMAQDGPHIVVRPVELPNLAPQDLFQVVVPLRADTIVVDSVVTALPWDGRSGGIIAIESNVIISDTGRIDVSGLGSRGGKRSINGGSCGIVQACDPETSDRTAGKGESIRLPEASCTNGHTPWANGGGGGDAHNAGGGGGGNGGAGGRGGNQFVCSAVPGMYGMSGMALVDPSQERLFFGGGGGGGHQNNNVATDGAPGGGMVIIRTHTITGDSLTIVSRGGNAAARAGNDGGGGGGGGGSISIEACYVETNIVADVQGGTGSMCDGGHGPGGGGGGGRIMLHPTLLQNFAQKFTFLLSGGLAGTVAPDNSNGAEPGAPGIVQALCKRTSPHVLFVKRAANVGDTLQMRLVARDTLEECESLIAHQIQFIGSAHTPLTNDLTWFDALQVDIRLIRPDTNVVTVTVPSKRSWSLPILAVLSGDSTTTVTHTRWLPSLTPSSECTWPSLAREITVDACALRIRPITGSPGLAISASTSQGVISITITSPYNAPHKVSLYSALGELIETALTADSRQISNSAWRFDHVFETASRAHGVYILAVETTGGVIGAAMVAE